MAVTNGCYCSQVRDGEAIITEGKKGDEFYIVESGLYSVTQQRNGVPQEIHTYHARQEGSHPSFGELALMYDKPRAATVTAKSDGVLWVIDRRSFRSILMKSEQLQVDRLRVLRRASALKPLPVAARPGTRPDARGQLYRRPADPASWLGLRWPLHHLRGARNSQA